MNTTVWWESQLERDYIYLLEIDPDVIAYQGQPFTIAYDNLDKRKKYTPDFLVERKSSKQIVEVKPASKVEKFKSSYRFSIAVNFCSLNDLRFVVLTEESIQVQPRLDNIKLLYKYARVSLSWSIYADCFDYFHSVKLSTISETEKSLEEKGVTQSSLLKLLWDGFLVTDLQQSISPFSSIRLSPSATDLSRVYVLDSANCQFIEVPALHQEYTQGLTLWQHKVIKQLARNEADTIDIVALALAKEKIQTIVEGEWKQSKRGKTRQSMARWLGIESSVSNAEIDETLMPLPKSEPAKNNSLEVPIVKPISLSGISNLDSAIDTSSISSESKPSAIEIEVKTSEIKTDSNLQQQNTSVADRAKLVETKTTQTEETEEDWQPDLSGWDVSYGLPK